MRFLIQLDDTLAQDYFQKDSFSLNIKSRAGKGVRKAEPAALSGKFIT